VVLPFFTISSAILLSFFDFYLVAIFTPSKTNHKVG